MANKRNAAEEMKKMQEEAIKRVKEMHARSKPTEFKSMQYADTSHAREKIYQNTEKIDNILKKRNIPEKSQYAQKRNSNFNLRKTRFVKNPPPTENQNFTSYPKKFKLGNIMGDLPNFMDLLFKDGDKSLLIVLIILLMDDEENFMILLVLFYLLI